MSSRSGARQLLAGLGLTAMCAPLAVLLSAGAAQASTPATSTLTVPPSGSVSAEYTGSAPPGTFASSTCPAPPPAGGDDHTLNLTVPPGTYDGLTATIEFKIVWNNGDNDLILEVFNSGGTSLGRSDGGSPEEKVELTDLPSGNYTARVCGFLSTSVQPYNGTITVTTFPEVTSDPALPTVETGLEFGASLVTDPQRSQGESAAFADASGALYSCGTNGALNGTDHGSASVDGGETWYTLGTQPVGETGTVQGGGDCAIGTGQDLNSQGKRQLAFIGLGPLTGFSTFSSPDNGRTLVKSATQNRTPDAQKSLVDRQWLVFTDAQTVLLNYNAALVSGLPGGVVSSGQVVQKSTDGGLTYGPQIQAATDGSRLGQIRAIREGVVPGLVADTASAAKVDPTKDVVYFPYNSGSKVKLAMSFDGGTSWTQCVAVDAQVDPTAGFVAADHDSAGNIYVTYAEKGGSRDTYLVALTADKVKDCRGPNPANMSIKNDTNPGFTPKIKMNREGVNTTVMPWVIAGGAPGRVAVAYYGTPSLGNPDSNDFVATWNVYVSQTLSPFAADPAIDQAQATTHPNHYNSICLNGLACDTTSPGDRSLVDYFTMAFDPTTGRLLVVYNQAAKQAMDTDGRIAAPVSIVQRGGQSNGGGVVAGAPATVRTSSGDVGGDAFARYSTADSFKEPTTGVITPGVSQPGPNVPALDLLGVEVGPQVDLTTGQQVADGGFTVTMRYADLSSGAVTSALTNGGTSLVYLFRFFDGDQPGGAAAYFEGGTWRFGMNDYETSIVNPQGNVQTYRGQTSIQGKVDQTAGTIRLSVPLAQIEALSGPAGPNQRPAEVPATQGSRVYDAAAFSFLNPQPSSAQAQSYLLKVDNTAAFDFVLGAFDVGEPVIPEVPAAVLLPLAASLLAAGAYAVHRRRLATVA